MTAGGRVRFAVAQYLARHAAPEARLAHRVDGRWARALVVPACAEAPALLDGFRVAAQAASGRTLIVLVVNATEDAEPEVHEKNAAALAALGGAGLHLGNDFDVWILDRASTGRRMPSKQGVGLARRIGADLAVALCAAGRLDDRFVYSSDADVTLPAEYFSVAGDAPPQATAIVFPFWHTPSRDAALDRASALYELSLRYYVLGLAYARSPHALHTLGSTLAVDAAAYARVRGFPPRRAGEDFHILAKLLKVGPVLRARPHAGSSIQIATRRSSRVPFGTGPAVARLEAGAELSLYAPESFAILGNVLDALDAFARDPDLELFLQRARAASPAAADALIEWQAPRALRQLAEQAPTESHLMRQLHGWLDALRTLRLVHALRRSTHPSLPWREALERAPFVPALGDQLDELRQLLARAEPSGLCGPTLPR